MKKKHILIFALQFIFYFIGLNLGSAYEVFAQMNNWDQVIHSNVFIDNIEVKGKNILECKLAIESGRIGEILKKTIHISVEDKEFSMPLSEVVKENNLNEIIEDIINHEKDLDFVGKYKLIKNKVNKNYQIKFSYDTEKLADFINKIGESIEKEPQNATITKDIEDSIQVKPHNVGYKIDNDALIISLEENLRTLKEEDIYIKHPVKEISPEITEDELTTVNTKIATYNTDFGQGNSGRITNIKTAAKAIDDILLMPGETFSFYKNVGDTTKEKGYEEGPIIVGNSIVQGLGGGICQVSSTLYNAVLLTGINSKDRINHSLPSSYVPMGLDATVSGDYIDYSFENTLKYPIFIETYTQGTKLYVDIYSNLSLVNKRYKMETEVYDIIEAPINYVEDQNLKPGELILVKEGRKGYKVKVTRKTFENEKLINSEVISYDNYRASAAVWKKGTGR